MVIFTLEWGILLALTQEQSAGHMVISRNAYDQLPETDSMKGLESTSWYTFTSWVGFLLASA